MNKKLLLPVFLAAITLFACSRASDEERQTVYLLEKQYTSDPKLYSNKVKTEEMLKAYIDFAGKYENDTATPHFLFNAANLAMNTNKPDMAIDLLKTIHGKNKNNRYAATSLFLIGFVYENYKLNLKKAKDAYNEFISTYPDHSLVPSAKASIENLGKSPEQLIREFEQKNQLDSLTAKK